MSNTSSISNPFIQIPTIIKQEYANADTENKKDTNIIPIHTDKHIKINSVAARDRIDAVDSSDDGKDSDSDDVVEPKEYESHGVSYGVFDEDYYFLHIYNGIVFKGSDYYPMIEFKIVRTDPEISEFILFKESQSKCGWFIVDGENSKLKGPVYLHKEHIKKCIRVIDDKNFPEIDGFEIESVSLDKESLIFREQIPLWMIKHMVSKV